MKVEKMEKVEFDKFYKKNFKRMVNYAYSRIGRIEPAEELVQDTFIEFVEKYDSRVNVKPFTFFFLKLRDNIKNYFSVRSNQEILRDFSEEMISNYMADPTEDTERLFFNIEIIRDSIDELPDREKEVIQKLYYENYSQDEIGDNNNHSRQKVTFLHNKALKRLKIHLKKRGVQ